MKASSSAMDTLNRLASSLSSSVTSTVFSTASAIKDVLPGNPVTREFEAQEHIASAGPGLAWKVYSGFKKSTKQPAAIFVLEKRALDRFDRQERDFLLDLYRKAVSQLTRLRHPQILTVQHPLEESRDCLAFATEPVYASLANVLGRHENMPSPVPSHVREYKMFDVEIKYGLMQLSEGLHFLHDGVKMLHRNLSPESIVINHQGAWKVFGFDFCVSNTAPANQPPAWVTPEYNHSTPPEGYPDLDFLAPEYGLCDSCSPSSDMFSLGMVAFALFNSKPLFTNSGNWGIYKKNAGELKTLRESNLQLIPPELKEYLKMLLSATPELRPNAAQFSKIGFFDDVGVKTLNNLDSQFQWDNLQKSQFYKGLPAVIPKLPHRVALHRVVPCLAKEFVNPHMVPFVLPSVLQIAEEATKADFARHVLPELRPVMRLTEPVQVLLIFMQRMEMLLAKTPPQDVKSDVLPMIYRALESDASQIQELCLSIIPGFAGLLDYQAMKNAVLPRIKKLCVSTTLLSVRVNCLICLGKLLSHLDKWLVIDEILPLLQQVPSREPAVVMGIVGIYKMSLEDDKIGLTKEVLATRALPFLFPLSVENGLTTKQYSVVMALIRNMVDRVEEEHSAKLAQLNSIQDEQKSALQISMSESVVAPGQLVPASSSSSGNAADDMFSGLGLGEYVGKKDSAGAVAASMMGSSHAAPVAATGTPAVAAGGGMSLEEKRRIMQQSEHLKKTGPPPSVPRLMSPTSAPTQPARQPARDLTQSLVDRNLTQMGSGSSGVAAAATTTSSSGGWGSFASPMPQQQQQQQHATPQMFPAQQQQAKPDLSAFDSLLSMPSSNKRPMGRATSPMGQQQQPVMAMPMGAGMPMGQQQQPMSAMMGPPPQQQQQQQVKTLSPSDINDLLG